MSAIARRLNLDDTDETAQQLLQAITHSSYVDKSSNATKKPAYSRDVKGNNEELAEVGRSILGFVLSEYYAKKFPNLPTKALKLLMTALTNPEAMESVASEVGLGKRGIPIRYERTFETEKVAITNQHRFTKMQKHELKVKGRKGGAVYEVDQVSTRSSLGLNDSIGPVTQY